MAAANALPDFTYHTSTIVKIALSRACSTSFNNSNLERLFYPAFERTFQEAISNSTRLVVCPQPDLGIPGSVVVEQRLFSRLADIQERMRSLDEKVDFNAQKATTSRVKANDERAMNAAITAAIAQYGMWETEVGEYLKADLEKEQREKAFFENVSIGQRSFTDNKAKGNIPDFTIDHLIAGTFDDIPPFQEMQALEDDEDALLDLNVWQECFKLQRETRSGMQVVHSCSVLISELKHSPSRDFWKMGKVTNESLTTPIMRGPDGSLFGQDLMDPNLLSKKWIMSFNELFDQAIEEIITYCSTYFSLHPSAESVIAFVGAGPYYQWTELSRKDAPSDPDAYDWISLLEDETLPDYCTRVYGCNRASSVTYSKTCNRPPVTGYRCPKMQPVP